MSRYLPVQIKEQNWVLSCNRTCYWEEEQCLILSDPHLGKSGHFRKSGIAIPAASFQNNLHRLMEDIRFFNPREVLITGDFSHSRHNTELDQFQKWRKDFASLQFTLIRGNHDILPDSWYRDSAIDVHPYLHRSGFLFLHDREDQHPIATQQNDYPVTGHVHPSIVMKGIGKQSLRLPCFYFASTHACLPAFGSFTGTFNLQPKKNDRLFVIAGQSVMPV
jgi:DNA ligase-associated metallophosphoesterase